MEASSGEARPGREPSLFPVGVVDLDEDGAFGDLASTLTALEHQTRRAGSGIAELIDEHDAGHYVDPRPVCAFAADVHDCAHGYATAAALITMTAALNNSSQRTEES